MLNQKIRPLWYVADMDAVLAACNSREEALAWCQGYTDDRRTAPFIDRLSIGLYAYTGPANAGPGSSKTYWYGTREAMIFNGFNIHIAEFEKKSEVLS